MKALSITLVLAVATIGLGGTAFGLETGFEEGLGMDGASIGSSYSGLTFSAASSGQDWIYADILNVTYNTSSWPSGAGGGQYWVDGNVCAWTGVPGDDGRIDFDTGDGTFLQVDYSAYKEGGGTALWLEAYDASDGLLDSDSGLSNLRWLDSNESGMGTLRVDAPAGTTIKYVLIHDTGDHWVVDNLRTDDTGAAAVPEPGSLALLCVGASGLLGLRVRRRRR